MNELGCNDKRAFIHFGLLLFCWWCNVEVAAEKAAAGAALKLRNRRSNHHIQ